MKIPKVIALILALAAILSLAGCGKSDPSADSSDIYERYPEAHLLQLEGKTAKIDGAAVKEFDYTWRADPSLSEAQFQGTEPEEGLEIYIAHDIIYYPEISESAFVKEKYDGEEEWVTRFTADGLQNYIFGTLPVLGSEFPNEMMHSASEAYDNPVLHITKPGKYMIEGSFNGQIFFDFGDEDETFANKAASTVVILNGANVTCSVAPAIIFHDVYECDNTWESREKNTDITDLSEAGVQIIIADGTENNFTGCNVYRLLKPEYKKDSNSVQKKLWKTDGAFYSFQSLAIRSETNGTGILNITGNTFEGLDSELHLTIDGGYVNIFSQDDGINVNEDDVSVFTLNGGHLTVFAGLGAEGDVIDSNGYIRINGGVFAGTSKSPGDELLDSDCGTFIDDRATVIFGGSQSGERPFGEQGEMPPERPDDKFGETPPDKPDENAGKMTDPAERKPQNGKDAPM